MWWKCWKIMSRDTNGLCGVSPVLSVIALSLQATHMSLFYPVYPARFRETICAWQLDITFSSLFFLFLSHFPSRFFFLDISSLSKGSCLLLVDEIKKALFFLSLKKSYSVHFYLETPNSTLRVAKTTIRIK